MYDKAHEIFGLLLKKVSKKEEYDDVQESHYYLFRSERAFHKHSYLLAASWARLARRNLWHALSFYGNGDNKATYDDLLDLLENIQSYCNAQLYA
jgi:hypothetical protein